jgi:hypothetical protein
MDSFTFMGQYSECKLMPRREPVSEAMGYEHDIFISYRRNPETLSWLTEHFIPLLELHVELELERKPKIYVDKQLESGASWPLSLGTALGNSRILIALWTGNYLSSAWCAEEFSQMLAREQEANLRTAERPNGVVIPAFVHDGEKFPRELGHIQYFEIQKCFNVRMQRTSPRAEELDAILTAQAPAIKECIARAPIWQNSWPVATANQFFTKYFQQLAAEQRDVPRFTGQ